MSKENLKTREKFNKEFDKLMTKYYTQTQSEAIKKGLKRKKVNLPCKEK